MELNWAICPSLLSICSILKVFEPAYEIMVLFVLHKLILQTHIRSHPVVLNVWFLVGPYVDFHTSCVRSEGSGETAWMCRLAWAFAARLCDKYHNLMSWLILPVIAIWQCSGLLSEFGCFSRYSIFFHHVWRQNTIIHAFETKSIRSCTYF